MLHFLQWSVVVVMEMQCCYHNNVVRVRVSVDITDIVLWNNAAFKEPST